MLSRRGHRLSRFRKNKRRLRERLRQRIFDLHCRTYSFLARREERSC